jgi:hypothetical protein
VTWRLEGNTNVNNTGRLIMFSVITNIYNKKTKETYLNGVESNGIDSSLAAVPVDLFGLCRKLARTRSRSSSAVNGRPLDFLLAQTPSGRNVNYDEKHLPGKKK